MWIVRVIEKDVRRIVKVFSFSVKQDATELPKKKRDLFRNSGLVPE